MNRETAAGFLFDRLFLCLQVDLGPDKFLSDKDLQSALKLLSNPSVSSLLSEGFDIVQFFSLCSSQVPVIRKWRKLLRCDCFCSFLWQNGADKRAAL